MSNRKIRKSTGFTLVETLLAIALLSMAVIAPLSIASNAVTAATAGKDRLIAVSLARDAVEYVRFIRDSNRFRPGVSWLAGLEDCLDTLASSSDDGNECIIDSLSSNSYNLNVLPEDTFDEMTMDSAIGLYGYKNSWAVSKYKRVVTIEELVANREVRVKAVVTWETTFNTKRVEVIDQLTHWVVQ